MDIEAVLGIEVGDTLGLFPCQPVNSETGSQREEAGQADGAVFPVDEAISSGHLDGGGEQQQGSLLGQGCPLGMGGGLLLPTHPH